MMNGHKEVLTIATSAESPDAGRPAVADADLEPPHLFEYLLPDSKPIAAPSWQYSSEDTKFIRSEVQRLLDADIIELARSPWRAQVFVVKQGEKKRLVIDYSVTSNRFTLLDAYSLPNIEDLVIQNQVLQLYWSSIGVSPSAPVSWWTALHRLGSWWSAFSVQTLAVCYQRRFCLPTQRSIHEFIERHHLKSTLTLTAWLTGETLRSMASAAESVEIGKELPGKSYMLAGN